MPSENIQFQKKHLLSCSENFEKDLKAVMMSNVMSYVQILNMYKYKF